jgi:hypothetical protein
MNRSRTSDLIDNLIPLMLPVCQQDFLGQVRFETRGVLIPELIRGPNARLWHERQFSREASSDRVAKS